MNPTAVNAVDITALVLILLTTLRGLHRGLSGELSALAGAVAALVLGLMALDPFGVWLEKHTTLEPRSAHALAFILTVAGVILAGIVAGFILRRVMKVVFNEAFDRPAGGVAGFLTGVTAVILVFLTVGLWPHPYLNEHFGKRSIIGRGMIRWMPVLRDAADKTPAVRAAAEKAGEKAEEIRRKAPRWDGRE